MMLTTNVIIPCFNPDEEILDTIQSLDDQKLSSGCSLTVTLVNDASIDLTYLNRMKTEYPHVEVIDLKDNKGRSGACHYGATKSDADVLVFLDSDCVLNTNNSLDLHLKKIHSGSEVSIGKIDVIPDQNDFWGKYFKSVSQRRDLKGLEKKYRELTSAYLAIKRETYIRVGGFDEAFKVYGFEDRDLLIRLVSSGAKMEFDPNIVAYHGASLSLGSICGKMKTAGRSSSGVFSKKHPKEYRDMSYSKIDVCIRPILRFPMQLFFVLFNQTLSSGEALIQSEIIPYRIKVFVVLFFSSLYFSKGTILRYRSV